jgi:hypothetical protein
MFSLNTVSALVLSSEAATAAPAPAAPKGKEIDVRGHKALQDEKTTTIYSKDGKGRFSLPNKALAVFLGISQRISNVDLKKLLVAEGGCKDAGEAARFIERSVAGFDNYNGFLSLLQGGQEDKRRFYLPVSGEVAPAKMLTTGPRKAAQATAGSEAEVVVVVQAADVGPVPAEITQEAPKKSKKGA